MKLPLLEEAQVLGKRVFLRSDLDVPLSQQSTIEDDTRLRYGLPTVEHLLKNGATVIVSGHLGRPKGVDKNLSLELVAKWLSDRLKFNDLRFRKLGDFDGWEISANLTLLENLRFHEEEEKNDLEFAKKLASLADIYINDAFSVVHRDHASVVGIAKLLPHFAGLRLQKEVEVLSSILESPKGPLVIIIGGVKMETKLPVITNLSRAADHILVGGKIAQEAKNLPQNVLVANLTPDGFDITSESVAKFIEIIQEAKTIVWNGPLGMINSKFEIRPFGSAQGKNSKLGEMDTEKGTREVAEAIAKSSAYKVVGGGDTLGYLQRLGIIDKFDFVSTGGGAMLAFLSGEKLPGLEALLR